jgi:hypothetical protein
VPGAPVPSQCALPKPDIADFWLVLGPRGGAAAIIPQAGGPAIDVPVYLVSLGFTGTVTLSLDTTQPDGAPATGVAGSFGAGSLALLPGNPLTPLPSTLTITTTASTPNGFYPLTVIATDGKSLTRTATFFVQVGSPSSLALVGNTTIQKGTCSIFQIHTVDSNGNPSDVLSDTYLNATGIGSGTFYQDSRCSTPVDFQPVNAGCPPGIQIPQGDYAPHFGGTQSIWFMDPTAENLNMTISDESNGLKAVTAAIHVQ